MVTQLLADNSIDFDRFCFYGCYCLPDATIHDSSPGTGQPTDAVDNSCRELKMCYQCANRDHQTPGKHTGSRTGSYRVIKVSSVNRMLHIRSIQFEMFMVK